LKGDKYDVVFTDLRMPGMTGLDVAESIKARQPWTPVVIVTGYGSERSEERARAAGVSDFLHKPLSPEMIQDSTEKALLAASVAVVEAPAQASAAPTDAKPEPAAKPNTFKNMALFLCAPFIGLLYAILLPFVGLGMLAWFGAKAFTAPPADPRHAE
jgi:DNA-binding NarL/FixJ family response regulator